jgi:hypothetical protein
VVVRYKRDSFIGAVWLNLYNMIGHTSQVYAIRQALAKAIVAFYQKFVDEAAKKEIKEILVQYDRTLLVADPRRCEPKKVRKELNTFLYIFLLTILFFIVRWSRCSCPFPKVLPLKKYLFFLHGEYDVWHSCAILYFFIHNLVDSFCSQIKKNLLRIQKENMFGISIWRWG